MAENEEGQVSFSVKELLNRIDGKLDTMALAISAKADHDEVVRLEARVNILYTAWETGKAASGPLLKEYAEYKAQVDLLSAAQVSAQAVRMYKRYVFASAIAAITAMAALVAVLFHVRISIP